jgi:Uma2 family endonuclease
MLILENKKKYTYEDYMSLEEGAPFQLINYDLVLWPSRSTLHQVVLGDFYYALKTYLIITENAGMVVVGAIDVKFDEGNVFQPDLIYISRDRVGELVKERVEGAPDLVVEILSPANAYYDLRQKKDVYERYGVQEYIIVDPIATEVELYSLNEGVFQLHQKVRGSGAITSLVLPGFTIELSEIFKLEMH